MDALGALRLLIEWGADEAVDAAPHDRRNRAAPQAPAMPRTTAPAPTPAAEVDAGTLAALREALDRFTGCALRHGATNTVAPSGTPATGLAIIGEAPSADDDRTGQPFSGPLGQQLDRMLASIGLDRSGVLLAHLVPWRPPGGRSPNEMEVKSCLPFLLRHLALARPRRLVLLGSAPVKTLAGRADTIRRLRGKWLSLSIPGLDGPIPALPLLPPDQITTPAARRAAWADLLTLRVGLGEFVQ